MKIQITLAPLEQPTTLFCTLCTRYFQAQAFAAQLSAESWWVWVCPSCLPSKVGDTALRESALGHRESLLWLSRVMERIAYGPAIESPTREELEQANAHNLVNEAIEQDERSESTTIN